MSRVDFVSKHGKYWGLFLGAIFLWFVLLLVFGARYFSPRFLLPLCLLFGAPAVPASVLIIWAGRRRVDWDPLNLSYFVIPFLLRISLDLLHPKGDWNLPLECFYSGVSVPIAFLVLVILGRRRPRVGSASILLALCGVVVALWLGVRPIYEN
jgi:hypothetical protein